MLVIQIRSIYIDTGSYCHRAYIEADILLVGVQDI
jgi:hypothetical protein